MREEETKQTEQMEQTEQNERTEQIEQTESMEQTDQTKQPGKSRKALWTILMVLSLLVFLVCGIILGRYYLKQWQAKKVYDNLKNEYVEKDSEKDDEDETGTEEDKPKVTRGDLLEIDFESLWTVNPEIYAWVEIPGTAISYPVLQRPADDSYYLNHTVDYKEGLPGSIYSESITSTDFSEYIHILYGHNMKNKTMFGGLHYYENDGYLEENSYIYIYTPEHIYVYHIFATVVVSDAHIMYAYDFTTEEGRQTYIDYLYGLKANNNSRNHYLEEAEVTAEDKLLTLSTCIGNDKSHRYTVNAVLLDTIDK